jgi:ribosomal protein L14E/L6E/L27E
MKNNIVFHILLFALMMVVYQCASAQDYILTARGDSVTGEVKPLLYGPNKKVELTSAEDEKTSYSIFEVRAFSHEGDIYHPIKGDQGYVFMKLIQPGYLSLYAYQPENQTRFDGLFLKKMDGENMVVPNLGFRKYMSRFLEDCPQVAEKVKTGELGKKNLTELIDAYNACIDRHTITHDEIIASRHEQAAKISAWDSLEEKILQKDFSERNNALEMIAEIRKKIQREEKIPNFLVEALKNSLKDTGLTAEVELAIEEIE